jgi:hypothetical protein
MMFRRSVLIAVLIAAVLLIAGWLFLSPSKQSQWIKDLPTLAAAVQRYSHDQVWLGRTLKPTVALQDLADGGYLSPGTAREFTGADVTLYPNSNESDKNAVLVRLKLADGGQVVALADGSVQTRSK